MNIIGYSRIVFRSLKAAVYFISRKKVGKMGLSVVSLVLQIIKHNLLAFTCWGTLTKLTQTTPNRLGSQKLCGKLSFGKGSRRGPNFSITR